MSEIGPNTASACLTRFEETPQKTMASRLARGQWWDECVKEKILESVRTVSEMESGSAWRIKVEETPCADREDRKEMRSNVRLLTGVRC